MGKSCVAFVHYDSPIYFIYTIIFYLTQGKGIVNIIAAYIY